MNSHRKIENKSTAGVHSSSNCTAYYIKENLDCLSLPLTIKTDPECIIIDLTADSCVSPVDGNVQSVTNKENKTLTPKNKIDTLHEPTIQSMNFLTSGRESKKQLKQTHLNSFFASAKNAAVECKSFENQIKRTDKSYSFMKPDVIDECQCSSIQRDKINYRTLQTDEKGTKRIKIPQKCLNYRTKKRVTVLKPNVIDLCTDSDVESKNEELFDSQQPDIKYVDKHFETVSTYQINKAEKTDLCIDSVGIIKSPKNQNRNKVKTHILKNPDAPDFCLNTNSKTKNVVKISSKVSKKSVFELPQNLKNSLNENQQKSIRKTCLEKRTLKSPEDRSKGKINNKLDLSRIQNIDVKNFSTKETGTQKIKQVMKENELNTFSKTVKAMKMNSARDLSLSEKSDHLYDNKIETIRESIRRRKRPGTVESEKNECPPYKVIEGTTFAVDAFNYGRLKNVTAYFLTHFHTDHYVGLTKKFLMPIYASEITINLIRGFISVDEKLLNILFLNMPIQIEGVLVTAIDANHCPGAVMILFELPCGKRILHTGDFRWSRKMELDLNLQQQHIELIYLDTTHISDKHIISSQEECISKAIHCVREFKQRNESKKILFVVCTDVIGKEHFWLSIAQAFDLKVWSDGKRKKALSLIGNEEILKNLVSNANEADLHIVSHTEAGYKHLDEYFRQFSDSYDMVLSIKPKGSESLNTELEDQVSSISVRYSEHSTHKELRRFLRFLLPKRVISTVPLGKNIFRCAKVPVSWHTKELYVPYRKQSSLLNYVSVKASK